MEDKENEQGNDSGDDGRHRSQIPVDFVTAGNTGEQHGKRYVVAQEKHRQQQGIPCPEELQDANGEDW
ncbi:hypothetical protein ACVIDN_006584 [Rhizobium brockwellii]